MRYKLILLGMVTMIFLSNGNAQNSSLFFDKVYEGKSGKPVQAFPAWSEFSVNGEGAKVVQNEEGDLCVGIAPNTIFGYKLPFSSVGDITSPYAVEYALRMGKPGQGIDVDLRTPEGEQVSFTIQNQCLIDRMGCDTLCKNMDNSGWSVFRFVMDANQQTNIYKNGVLLSSLPRVHRDIIVDPGFEQSDKIDPIWWWSDWSQVVLDGNNPHSGNKSLHWENGWTGQLGARIPVQPNAKYRLTYWAKAVKVNASQSMMKGVLRVGGVNKATLNIPVGDYRQFVTEFTTSAHEEMVELEFHNGWGNSDAGAFAIYIDDMELTRMEGEPYIQFGKMDASGGDYILRYVAVSDEVATPVLFADLASLIVRSKTLLDTTVVGGDIGNYPQYAADCLQSALQQTEGVTAESEYLVVDEAYARLERETIRFNRCRITNPDLEFSVLEIPQLESALRVMERVRLSPSGSMNDGTMIDKDLLFVTYASENQKLSVDEEGYLTAMQAGEDFLLVNAYYKNAQKKLRIPVRIETYKIQTLMAEPYETPLRLGDATGIKTSVTMTGGKAPLENEVVLSYKSLTPEVAEINANGTILAKTPGTATIEITATFMEQEMTTSFDIPVITVDRIVLELPMDWEANSVSSYLLKGYYTDGSEMRPEEEDLVVYSDHREVARVDDCGTIYLGEAGEAVLTARVKQAMVEKKHSVKVVVESPLALPVCSQLEKELVLYPNPAKGSVKVNLPDEVRYTSIAIATLEGEVMLKQNLSSKVTEVNLEGLLPGVYVVFFYGEKTGWSKLVVL